MTQFEQEVKPPFPLNRMGVCWLIVEDPTNTINFRKDLLWFEVKYLYTKDMGEIGRIIWAEDAKIMGSIRAYLSSSESIGDNIFNCMIEFDCPFKLTISSPDNIDISGLKVTTKELITDEVNTETT